MQDAVTAYLGLGSNLGDRTAYIQRAIGAIARLEGTTIVEVSPVYESGAHTPTPGTTTPNYLNAVARISTTLAPRDLLTRLLEIERSEGRDRAAAGRWQSRTLDVDILIYGEAQIDEPGLTIPHPLLSDRLFVLAPLADLNPSLYIPGRVSQPVEQLLRNCSDSHHIVRTDIPLTVPKISAG